MNSYQYLFFICIAITSLVSVVISQKVQPRAMPEPTKTYTCDETYHPTDLTFDGEILYSVSSYYELILEFHVAEPWEENESKPEAIVRHKDFEVCEQMTTYPPSRPFSIALTPQKLLCTNYHSAGLTGTDSFFPFVSINCLEKERLALTPFENSGGNGNGLAATPEGLWVAHWQSVSAGDGTSKIDGRISLLPYQALEKSFQLDRPKQPEIVKPLREISIDRVPYFIDANPQDNSLWSQHRRVRTSSFSWLL